jgi:hypothetical protein
MLKTKQHRLYACLTSNRKATCCLTNGQFTSTTSSQWSSLWLYVLLGMIQTSSHAGRPISSLARVARMKLGLQPFLSTEKWLQIILPYWSYTFDELIHLHLCLLARICTGTRVCLVPAPGVVNGLQSKTLHGIYIFALLFVRISFVIIAFKRSIESNQFLPFSKLVTISL